MKLNVRFEQSVPLSFFSRFRFFTLLARYTLRLQMVMRQMFRVVFSFYQNNMILCIVLNECYKQSDTNKSLIGLYR